VASTKRTARAGRKKYVPSAEQRADDERLREALRHADIGKLKKLMAPLIERREESATTRKK
jgi:hypothetical protein